MLKACAYVTRSQKQPLLNGESFVHALGRNAYDKRFNFAFAREKIVHDGDMIEIHSIGIFWRPFSFELRGDAFAQKRVIHRPDCGSLASFGLLNREKCSEIKRIGKVKESRGTSILLNQR